MTSYLEVFEWKDTLRNYQTSKFQKHTNTILEVFYLNTIEQLFLFVEQLDQLEVCLPYSRLLAGIPILSSILKSKVEFK